MFDSLITTVQNNKVMVIGGVVATAAMIGVAIYLYNKSSSDDETKK